MVKKNNQSSKCNSGNNLKSENLLNDFSNSQHKSKSSLTSKNSSKKSSRNST